MDSPALREALERGRYTDGGRELFARPVAVEPARDATDSARVRLELFEAPPQGFPPTWKRWARAIRAVSLTATATPCVAILLFGLVLHRPLALGTAIAALLGALALQLAINLLNDVEDHHRLIDLPGTLGGAGVIQDGWLSSRLVRRVAWACLALGVILGIPAFLRAPVPLTIIGVLALIGTAGYSGKPFGLKYHALGDLAVLALCGPGLTAGFSLAAFGTFDPSVLLLGVFFGAAAMGILHANNMQDVEVDRRRGAVTVAALLGPSASRVYLAGLYVLAYGALGLAWWLSRPGLAALVVPMFTLPLALGFVKKVVSAPSANAPGLEMIRVQAAQIHLAMGAALCVGMGVSLALR